MNYNIDKFKGYKANKLKSQSFNSILDAFESRCEIERLVPDFTFSDPNYGKGVKFTAKAFYTSDGFDFTDVEKLHDNEDISVSVNKTKLERFLDNDDNDYFDNINQALSILAVGNIHDILRSENMIKSTLYKNKVIKKNLIISTPNFRLCATTDGMKMSFGDFSKGVETFFENAHKYSSVHPTM